MRDIKATRSHQKNKDGFGRKARTKQPFNLTVFNNPANVFTKQARRHSFKNRGFILKFVLFLR
jgi:hypothetical protein